MASDPSFAPPLGQLPTPALSPPGVAIDPAGGQGFSLDERGSIPIATKEGLWRVEYVTASFNLPSIAAHTAGTDLAFTSAQGAAIANVAVGDLIIFIGVNDPATGAVTATHIFTCEGVASTAGTIKMRVYNAHTGAIDPDVMDFDFLIIHRFL